MRRDIRSELRWSLRRSRVAAVLIRAGAATCGGVVLVAPSAEGSGAWHGVPVAIRAEVVLLDRTMRGERVELIRLDAQPQAGGRAAGQVVYIDGTGARKTRRVSELAGIAPAWWPLTADEVLGLSIRESRSHAAAEHAASSEQTVALEGTPGDRVGPPEEHEASPFDVKAAARTGDGFVELVDGQRLTGRAAPVPPADSAVPDDATGGQSLQWQTALLGGVTVPLDAIVRATLVTTGQPTAAPPGTDASALDTVWLINGDRVEGLVESIGSVVVVEQRRAGGAAGGTSGPAAAGRSTVRVGIDQVAALVLSNPRRPAAGALAWLGEGSVVLIEKIETDSERERVTLRTRPAQTGDRTGDSAPGASASMEMSGLAGIVFDATSVAALADLPIARQGPLGERRLAPPALVRSAAGETGPAGMRAGAASLLENVSIVLPGPMEVEWALPRGATRLVGWAQLDESAWTWGDCEVVVSIVGAESKGGARELARQRLNAARPVFGFNVELGARAAGRVDHLRISVEPGQDGPIQDRVILRQAVLTVDPTVK